MFAALHVQTTSGTMAKPSQTTAGAISPKGPSFLCSARFRTAQEQRRKASTPTRVTQPKAGRTVEPVRRFGRSPGAAPPGLRAFHRLVTPPPRARSPDARGRVYPRMRRNLAPHRTPHAARPGPACRFSSPGDEAEPPPPSLNRCEVRCPTGRSRALTLTWRPVPGGSELKRLVGVGDVREMLGDQNLLDSF